MRYTQKAQFPSSTDNSSKHGLGAKSSTLTAAAHQVYLRSTALSLFREAETLDIHTPCIYVCTRRYIVSSACADEFCLLSDEKERITRYAGGGILIAG